MAAQPEPSTIRATHLACDNFSGTNTALALKGLDEMSDAVAHAVLFFSKTKVDVGALTDSSALQKATATFEADSVGPLWTK